MAKRFEAKSRRGVNKVEDYFLDLEWIPREVHESDVGIDMNVEQSIDGNPTAQYISVQIKTGSVTYIESEDCFRYYMSHTHYNYWLASSIPVILVYCDLDSEQLYWELVAKKNIASTDKRYKIDIDKEHVLSQISINELNEIIQLYQKPRLLPEDIDDMDESEVLDYSASLLEESKLAMERSNDSINGMSDKMSELRKEIDTFLLVNSKSVPKSEARKFEKKILKKINLRIGVTKQRILEEIPRISEHLVNALAISYHVFQVNDETKDIFCKSIEYVQEPFSYCIDMMSQYINEHYNRYEKKSAYSKAEHLLILTIEDYRAELIELSHLMEYYKELVNS